MASSPGQFWQLTKPRVVALIVFTAVIGMFLAMPTPGLPGFVPPWRVLVFGSLGIWLAAASAAASFAVTYALGKAAVYYLHGRRLGTADRSGIAAAYQQALREAFRIARERRATEQQREAGQ